MDNPIQPGGEKKPNVSGQAALAEARTYNIQGKTFIVEPVFKIESNDTIATILLRLMCVQV